MRRRVGRRGMWCKCCRRISWRRGRGKSRRRWGRRRGGMMRWKRRSKGKERGKDNVNVKNKDKNNAGCNNNSPRARISAPPPPPPLSPTPNPGTHTPTRVKNNPPSQNKTTITTVPPNTTPQITARVRVKRKTAGWEIRRVGVFMARSMVGRRRSIWIGPIRPWIRMPGGSDGLWLRAWDECPYL